MSRKADDADQVFAGVEAVFVSSGKQEVPGIKTVNSPGEAVQYLADKGYETALFSGGETLHNSVLEQNLADELIFKIAPTLESKGLNLLLPPKQHKEVKLLNYKDIGGGVIQLHHELSKR